MITTDIDSLFIKVRKEQLVTLNSKLPAGYGIISEGQVKHVVSTNFAPMQNKDLIRQAEKMFNITWKYAYVDNTSTNFAFCGVINDIALLDPRGDLIQLGVEIINSYNQRSGSNMYYCIYNHKKDCWIKTNITLESDTDVDDITKIIKKLTNIEFGITDIPNSIPAKLKNIVVANMNGHHDAYDFILALSTAATRYWEHTSYELSRKTTTKIFEQLIRR